MVMNTYVHWLYVLMLFQVRVVCTKLDIYIFIHKYINTTGATCGEGIAYTSGAPEIIPDF